MNNPQEFDVVFFLFGLILAMFSYYLHVEVFKKKYNTVTKIQTFIFAGIIGVLAFLCFKWSIVWQILF